MALQTMYPSKPGSPLTSLAQPLAADGTSMTLDDATVLPSAPNIAVIGSDSSAEIVSYTAITGNVVSGLVRGLGGTTASAWTVNTAVARNITSYDHDTFKYNIEALNTGKTDEAPSDSKAYSRINGEWSTNVTAYGYCETAAATVAKTVSITGFKLVTGATIFVKFKEKNTATNPTLNVSSTGAKRIYRWGTTSAGTTDASNGWQAGAVLALTYDGTGWIEHLWQNTTYTLYGAYSTTAADTAAKVASCTYYDLMPGYIEITMRYTNTAQSALTLNIASKGAKPIYINGTASSSTNYTLLNGVYIVYYDGTNYYFRTDGKIEGLQTTLTFDTTPTASSTNPVTSDGIKTYVDNKVLYYSTAGSNAMTVNVATNAQIGRIPASGTDSKITTNTVVLSIVFANPSAITSNVSWTSYAGYITFSGTCTSATTANVILGVKGN